MTLDYRTWKNIASLPKHDCFGCAVCVDICPVDCIDMRPDHEGFLYPAVDDDLCIECGDCLHACPALNKLTRQNAFDAPFFYAGFNNDQKTRYLSSSGGIFSLIARQILSKNGAVYGAIYDYETLSVQHTRADSEAGVGLMRKSKYVQSSSQGIFRQVQQDLEAGLPVLFTGTPCQAAGLQSFLGQTYPHLLICDFICHGVPSPGLFTRHFQSFAKQDGAPITKIDFRTKAKGWGSFLNFYLEVETIAKHHLIYAPLDAFYALFLANLILRPVCYHCPYTNLARPADITFGDFWGVRRQAPELFDGLGTSLLLASTIKGQTWIDSIRSASHIKRIPTPQNLQPNLRRPTAYPNLRRGFFDRFPVERWPFHKLYAHLLAILILTKNKLMGFFPGDKRSFQPDRHEEK